MFRLALRNVTARFGRIVLTALAIIVSTAFLSGTFIFRDTLESSFDALFAKSFENVDVYVQSANSVETAFGDDRRRRAHPRGAGRARRTGAGVGRRSGHRQGR